MSLLAATTDKDKSSEDIETAEAEKHEEAVDLSNDVDPSNDVLGLIFETKGPFRKAGLLELKIVFWYIW